MKRKSSVIGKLLNNLNRLVPFVGFLFVIAGILGLIFVQKPLDQSQELRSDASESEFVWPSITAANPDQDFYINESSQISLNLNTSDTKVKNVNAVFNIIGKNIENLTVLINAGSGLKAENVEVEKVSDGYLVGLRAIPNNLDWYIPPSDVSLIKINFIPLDTGSVSLNFDKDNTYLETPETAYDIKAETITFDILEKQEETTDHDTKINQCNESCDSNANCDIGYRCYDTGSGKKCRLATNPSSSDCSTLPDSSENGQCNEYCANSDECEQGLSCWWNQCRNPNNVESSSCADLTQIEQAASINSCGETCSSNNDCAINLRCYNNECRLATNPSSLTCSAATKETVSQIYQDQEEIDSETTAVPLKKGDNVITESEPKIQDVDTIEPTAKVDNVFDEDVPIDETAFDLLLKMLKDKQQNLPTTVILIGIGLLTASLILLLIARLSKNKKKRPNIPPVDNKHINIKSHAVNPGNNPTTAPKSAQNTKLKDLITKLDEQSKNQNQG